MKLTKVRPSYNPLYQDDTDVLYEKVYDEMKVATHQRAVYRRMDKAGLVYYP